MLARCATALESRAWPASWRETCSTSVPAKLPRETSASPQGVATGSGPPPSKPGSEYVPDPVMIPIAMARERMRNVGLHVMSHAGDRPPAPAGEDADPQESPRDFKWSRTMQGGERRST